MENAKMRLFELFSDTVSNYKRKILVLVLVRLKLHNCESSLSRGQSCELAQRETFELS